jgi:2-polyprenyl-3-methyl-5-hydroxy-6-metoxy-1,4-benzoquinol methylase
MATVFMKWLETRPEDYDRGIHLLTLGRLGKLQMQIAKTLVNKGDRVLEIGCGTGSLSIVMAQAGAQVTAIDTATAMLTEAERKIHIEGLTSQIDLKRIDAATIGDHFEPRYFDLIVGSLVFSEMPVQAQMFVLRACSSLLAPDGMLVILDEVQPERFYSRWALNLVRFPFRILTWLLTRTTTHPLQDFVGSLARVGYSGRLAASELGGSLQLILAEPSLEREEDLLPDAVLGRLQHQVTLRTILTDLWTLVMRLIPPYPKVQPGLYVVGQPDSNSPVLVTGNFDLTVRRLVQAIDGQVDTWVLVVDSAGINVWCAAGGGFLNAEKILGALRISSLDQIVRHRTLVLPQLCANGVDGWRVRAEANWEIEWGPVKASDIPEYFNQGKRKTDEMRWVSFPLKDRIEMVTATLGLYGLMIMIPIAIFWRPLFWPVLISMLGLAYFYALLLPWIPGKDGLVKSVPLSLIAIAGFILYTLLWDPLPAQRIFNWTIGLIGLSVFTAGELQGMSPLMRGEQANWTIEAVIGLVLGLTYWLVPLVVGWR